MNVDFAIGSMTFIYSSDFYCPELLKYNLIPKSVEVSWDRYKGDFRIIADDLQFGNGERRIIDWFMSSDRSVYLGGFDLYFVGIPKD